MDMQHVTRWTSVAMLGAALTLGACGGGDKTEAASTTGDSGMASGEVAAGGTAGSMGAMGDSGAMGAGGAMGGAAGNLASLSEPDIMAMVGVSNAGEIATSDVATTKATNASVKAYARKMVTEHRAMQKQADQLATRLNVTPSSPDMATQKTQMGNQMTQQLSATQKGAAFDRQYIDGQVQMHQQTLTELQAMQNTANADVKALIQKAIPSVQAHLDEATRIQSQLGGTGATGGNSGAAGGTSGTGTGTTPSTP
jgi:putative membrane protein